MSASALSRLQQKTEIRADSIENKQTTGLQVSYYEYQKTRDVR